MLLKQDSTEFSSKNQTMSGVHSLSSDQRPFVGAYPQEVDNMPVHRLEIWMPQLTP